MLVLIARSVLQLGLTTLRWGEQGGGESVYCHPAGLEFHLFESKAIFILQMALPLENLKVNGKFLKGHQGQDKGQWTCR